jgi:hypothetical protein
MSERYKPRKVKSPTKAIREHCIECMGGRYMNPQHKVLVRECTTAECALHDFRSGVNPYNKKTLSKTQKITRTGNLDHPSFPKSLGKIEARIHDQPSTKA